MSHRMVTAMPQDVNVHCLRGRSEREAPMASPIEWATEAMRLSVFPLDAAITNGQHWERGVGSPPEVVNRPPQQPPRTIEEGGWNNGRLQVESQQGQIHWRTFSAAANPGGPPSIGSFHSAIPPFRALMDQWLAGHCPRANRIAFGANLMLPASSLQEAIMRLGGMLPDVSVAAEGVSDLMFRINRRRRSQCAEDWQINRLATWSVAEGINVEIVLLSGTPIQRPVKVEHLLSAGTRHQYSPASRAGHSSGELARSLRRTH